jgi:hypothetical protein
MSQVMARPGASGEHREPLRRTAAGGDIVARRCARGERYPSSQWMAEGSDVVARRVGRIAFGWVLIAGFAILAAPACWDALDVLAGTASRCPHVSHAARTIALTWLAAVVVGSVASRIAARIARSRPPAWLFVRSLTVPTFGIALLSPLTLHALLVLPFGTYGGAVWEGFDGWVSLSLFITGVAHLVFAGACANRVVAVAAGRPARSPRSVVGITVITSCLPFVLLLGIPPALVALTALPLVRLLPALDRLVERERRELTRAALPRAIVGP